MKKADSLKRYQVNDENQDPIEHKTNKRRSSCFFDIKKTPNKQ